MKDPVFKCYLGLNGISTPPDFGGFPVTRYLTKPMTARVMMLATLKIIPIRP